MEYNNEQEAYEEHLEEERQAEEDERAHIEAEAAAAEAEAMAKMAEEEQKRKECPHCGSKNIEYSNYEWFCLDCDEQWDQYGQDTK